MDPHLLLRGFGKFLAVVLASGLAGAGIGIGLAELSGDDAHDAAIPTTAPQSSITSDRTQTALTSTATSPTTTPAKKVYRVPRVQVLSAELGPVSASTGRALVAVRARVTNRGNRPLTIRTPALLSADDEVLLASAPRAAAGPLLRPIDPAASATGVLRFTLPRAVAQRLTATPAARLRVANRTVTVKLTTRPAG